MHNPLFLKLKIEYYDVVKSIIFFSFPLENIQMLRRKTLKRTISFYTRMRIK